MSIALVWFRQDLRLSDNVAFIEACNTHEVVIPIYILDQASNPIGRAQQWWLHHSLMSLSHSLKEKALHLILRRGDAIDVMNSLHQEVPVAAVYWNRCYEPLVKARDTKIKTMLREKGVEVHSFNGGLLIEPWKIKNKAGAPFKVFTPFWKHCLRHLEHKPPPLLQKSPKMLSVATEPLQDWGLLPSNPNWAARFSEYWEPGEAGAEKRLDDFIHFHVRDYQKARNTPVLDATSKLSPHLHFGEISPQALVRAIEGAKLDPVCDITSADHFLSELGWREFSYHLLYHFPDISQSNFKKEFDTFPWQNDDHLLRCWQEGKTGYPLVDAGMRELWHTGYMHNRVRMLVASFLTKDLFIDWRKGADWFLDTLLDADLANNSASWQWVAGCGADAAPYFRIFNPELQSEKFDKDGAYIRRWLPELREVKSSLIHKPWSIQGLDYPKPIVDHLVTRKKALQYYQAIKMPPSSIKA
jgi:deoxyribodipyrimidine photo-lyase